MTKKNAVYILGALILCWAWTGVVSKIQSSQAESRQGDFPLKAELVEAKWEKLAYLKPKKGERLAQPVDFVFDLQGEHLEVQTSSASFRSPVDFELIKRAYLDAGKGTSFFTVNGGPAAHFLVRVMQKGDSIELVGFKLDVVLNYLAAGLNHGPWYLLDQNQRVLASHEKNYIGESYSFGERSNSKNFKIAGQAFYFGVPQDKVGAFYWIDILGVLGIALMAVALMMSRSKEEAEVQEEVFDFVQPEPKKKEDFEQSLEDAEGYNFSEDEVKMVALSEEEPPPEIPEPPQQPMRLNYSEFLMDNPVLNSKQDELGNLDAPAPQPQPEKEAVQEDEPSSDADEWMKLAAELSADIDNFAKSMKSNKDSSSDSLDSEA